MFLAILIATVGTFLIMIIATNLIGMVIRGLYREQDTKNFYGDNAVAQEMLKRPILDHLITLLFIFIGLFFIYIMYRHVNALAAFAVSLMVVSRVPDLIWEITKNKGRKLAVDNAPKGWIYTVTSIITWLELVILWAALYVRFN